MAERPSTLASFEGRCPDCGEAIFEGDPIYLLEDEGEWVCEGCADEAEAYGR